MGIEFQSGALVFLTYNWAGAAIYLGVVSTQYLINENYTKLSFSRTFMVIINVGLNILLIQIYGIVGAAIAILVSYTFAVFSIVIFPKMRKQLLMMIKSLFLVDLLKYIRASK